MSLEEVLDKSKIDFPWNLNLEQSENLLKYLVEKLQADISYNISCYKSMAYKEEGVETFDISFEISAQIVSKIGKMERLEFYIVPGYCLNEHRKGARELWDDVREAVGRYFELR